MVIGRGGKMTPHRKLTVISESLLLALFAYPIIAGKLLGCQSVNMRMYCKRRTVRASFITCSRRPIERPAEYTLIGSKWHA